MAEFKTKQFGSKQTKNPLLLFDDSGFLNEAEEARTGNLRIQRLTQVTDGYKKSRLSKNSRL